MQQIAYVVQLGACKPICDLLVAKDVKIVRVLLDAINNIMKVGRKCSYALKFGHDTFHLVASKFLLGALPMKTLKIIGLSYIYERPILVSRLSKSGSN